MSKEDLANSVRITHLLTHPVPSLCSFLGMKRPRSPTQLLQKGSGGGHGGGVCLPFNLCGELLQEPEEGHPDGPQQKKRLLYSLCEVCNLQLNSAAQAQVHYNGRSHLRRVKQLNNGELPPSTGSGTSPAPAGTLTCSSTGKLGQLTIDWNIE